MALPFCVATDKNGRSARARPIGSPADGVDQDPLGKAAIRKSQNGDAEVWSRPLFDGTTAVGLFNRGRTTIKVTAKWSDLGLKGSQPVRDLWQRKDLGNSDEALSAEIPRHGAMLLKIGKAQTKDWRA